MKNKFEIVGSRNGESKILRVLEDKEKDQVFIDIEGRGDSGIYFERDTAKTVGKIIQFFGGEDQPWGKHTA